MAAALMAARPVADDRIRAALWFAGQGFGVFSCWSTNDAGVCRCPLGTRCQSPGKHPIPPDGFKAATTDPERIRTQLSAGSDPNYGLLPPEGVFILDVDGDGVARLAELEETLGGLPATLRTTTAKGQHIFLRWPARVPRPIGQLFGYVTRWGSGPHAGYVLGPRSVHPSGAEYTPEGSSFEIAEVPESWVQSAIGPAGPTIRIASGGYQLPARVPASESRYDAILAYTAWLYNRGIPRETMWTLVLNELAPRFEQALAEPELRDRFERATKDFKKYLGEDRKSTHLNSNH